MIDGRWEMSDGGMDEEQDDNEYWGAVVWKSDVRSEKAMAGKYAAARMDYPVGSSR